MAVHGMSGCPWLEEDSSSSTSARRRATISFEEVAVFFKDEEWTLLDPCQRKLFWDVMEENYEMVASLGKDISQKGLQTLERSALHIDGVQGPVFPRGGERKIWNMEFRGASLLSCFPQLEGEFGLCTFTGRSFSVSFEEVAVSFAEEEWALLDPGQRKLCWEVMKENHETLGSLVAETRETVWEKGSGKVVVEDDYGLQGKVKCSDQVVPKEVCRSKTEAKQKHRKKLAGSEGGNHPDELWKRKRRHPDPTKTKGFSLNKRERLHTGKKLQQYLECGKSFSQNDKRTTHQKAHAGEKPHQCLECGKSFSSKSHLTVHHRVHTGEKPYKCLVCGKSFSQKSSLTTHQRVHTGEKPYKCLECGRSFATNDALAKHQTVHAGGKPYKCLKCGKSFSRKDTLTGHQKIHRGESILMEYRKRVNQNCRLPLHPNKSLSFEAATVFLKFNWPPNSTLFLLPCLLAPKVT